MEMTFYILSSDPVVTLDLTSALTDQFPENRVVVDAASGPLVVVPVGRESCVFATRDALTDGVLRTLKDVSEAGGNVILIGPTGEPGFPASVLELPFTNQMILDTLSRICPDATAPLPEGHT